MARSYGTSCSHFYVPRCAQMRFYEKKYYQIEIILHCYVKQYRVFGPSNITRIFRIYMTDYTSPIARVDRTSSYIASRWPRYVEFLSPTQQ